MNFVAPRPDAVAEAFIDCLALLAGGAELGWVKRAGAVTTVLTKVPVATLNGVWATGGDVQAAEMEAGLEEVAAHGLPYCIQARPQCRAAAADAAERRGMVAAPQIPLMAAVGPVSVPEPRELAIRRLDVGESRLHAELAGAAFEAPPELFATIITETTLGLPAVRGYVGEVGGTPVATAIAATVDDAVGVFNVATAAEHRRRGYGAAVTSRAISDGRAAGASWSWLQSAEAASRVYERLGFATLEHWSCWLSG
jgi:ribosomal protein S18 acetylase RimI-like enzyme